MKKTGPTLARGQSKQDVQTDPLFMCAVRQRFDEIAFDLAASEENKQALGYFSKADDSLKMAWHGLIHEGVLWLNPPFGKIEPWAEKCADESKHRCCRPILFLVPASIGSNWYWRWVQPYAHVIALNGRLKFVGHKDWYPKDMMLCVYWRGLTGFSVWDWSVDVN